MPTETMRERAERAFERYTTGRPWNVCMVDELTAVRREALEEVWRCVNVHAQLGIGNSTAPLHTEDDRLAAGRVCSSVKRVLEVSIAALASQEAKP